MPYISLDRANAVPAPTTDVGAPTVNNGFTFAQLVSEIQAQLLGRTDLTPARVKLMINLAYTDICSSLKIEELQASVDLPMTGTNYLYRLPPVVQTINEVSLVDPTMDPLNGGRPLEKSDFRAFRGRPVLSSSVREYFRYTDMLVVWPTPEGDGSLSVDFRIRPEWLIEDDACPILNVEWQEGLILLARAKLLNALQEWEAAMVANNDYINFVRRRQDTAALEEDNKIVRSSVPRHGSQVGSPRSPRRPR